MQGLSLPQLPHLNWSPYLFMPCGNEDGQEEEAQSTEAARTEKRQLRVLVVDDAPDVLEMFDMMLRLSGYDVAVAASAPEALEHASTKTFDVIVSDIGMPEMNGYELARRVRKLPGYETVPMIAVTGFSRYSDHQEAIASGFNAHLSKPVNPITLLELIERLRE